MTPATAFANLRLATGTEYETEIRTLQAALAAAKSDARTGVKAQGILEAVLREIHGEDPKHRSRIECAWAALEGLKP